MCTFSINFSQTPQSIIAKANQAIVHAGGKFSGDESSGNFFIATPFGKIEGSYSIMEQTIDMHITHKPMFISCKQIEEKLRAYIL